MIADDEELGDFMIGELTGQDELPLGEGEC